jgi:hypothetical protein
MDCSHEGDWFTNRTRDCGRTRKTRRSRIALWGLALLAAHLCNASEAGAQTAVEQAHCRESVGKGVRKLAETVFKERSKCHRLRLAGNLASGTDCNDPGSSPASTRIVAAELKVVSLINHRCAAFPPANYGYIACPPPCDTIPIVDRAGLASCFICVAEEQAGAAVATVYGTPPVPALPATADCQAWIGTAAGKYLAARIKNQQRCQRADDRNPTLVDCMTADIKGRIARARTRADALIARCAAEAFSALDTCGTDVVSEQTCVNSTVDSHADTLFATVYRPTVPVPTSTPTPTPTPTPSLPLPTPTNTSTPTQTPVSVPPTPTPTIVVTLTGYRPQTEAYGAPFQRQAVPHGQNVNPGIGIRINGDDDNGDGIADRDEVSVGNDNDLVEVVLTVSAAPAPPGIDYVLRRDNGDIKVWSDRTKSGAAVLDSNDESVLVFGGPTQTVWVENPNGGSASLYLEARTAPAGPVVAVDQALFRPFTSIVIALGGENQVPSDPPDSNHGVFNIAATLYALGYDVHMYDEDNVGSSGAGAVYDEVVRAIQGRGITVVSIFGYSHGGGSTHDLAARLDSNRGGIGVFTFPYTAYIDGIRNSSDIDITSETRLPPATQYHVNYYQRNDLFIRGDSVSGANVDINVSNTAWGSDLVHTSIDDHPNVRSGVLDPLLEHVSP